MTLNQLRLAAGAGDVDPSAALRIDVVAAAEALYDAQSSGYYEASFAAEDKLERAARKDRSRRHG